MRRLFGKPEPDPGEPSAAKTDEAWSEPLPSSTPPPVPAPRGWFGRIVMLDETLTARLFARLLADDYTLTAMRRDKALESIAEYLDKPKLMPADVNIAYVAYSLLYAGDGNRAVPFVELAEPSVGAAVRVQGRLARLSFEGDIEVSVRSGREMYVLRLRPEAVLRGRLMNLLGCEVVVLAYSQSLRRTDLVGTALMVKHLAVRDLE